MRTGLRSGIAVRRYVVPCSRPSVEGPEERYVIPPMRRRARQSPPIRSSPATTAAMATGRDHDVDPAAACRRGQSLRSRRLPPPAAACRPARDAHAGPGWGRSRCHRPCTLRVIASASRVRRMDAVRAFGVLDDVVECLLGDARALHGTIRARLSPILEAGPGRRPPRRSCRPGPGSRRVGPDRLEQPVRRATTMEPLKISVRTGQRVALQVAQLGQLRLRRLVFGQVASSQRALAPMLNRAGSPSRGRASRGYVGPARGPPRRLLGGAASARAAPAPRCRAPRRAHGRPSMMVLVIATSAGACSARSRAGG